MAIVKVTITLQRPDRFNPAARSQRALQNTAEFSAMIDQGLMETGGPLTPAERAWAKKILSRQRRKAES